MSQQYDAFSIENEIAPELAPVLTMMKMGDASPYKGLSVEDDDIRMNVGP